MVKNYVLFKYILNLKVIIPADITALFIIYIIQLNLNIQISRNT